MDQISIRILGAEEIDTALNLIWEVFMEFVAPDYSEKGICTFESNFIKSEQFKAKFYEGKEIMYGAFYNGSLAGVLSISIHNKVSCVFVKNEYHRKGIGKRLFLRVITELRLREVREITLNSSPYGIKFYHALGFRDTGHKLEFDGIIYTPMKLDLNLEGIEF